MSTITRFKMHNFNISLHKMRSSFREDEDIVISFSSCKKLATKFLSKTGLSKSLPNNFDTTLYDSIFFTNYGFYCLICDLSGKYLTHIFIKYINLSKVNLEIFPDRINVSLTTRSNHSYNGELFGDLPDESKNTLKSYKVNIVDSKIVRFIDHSESAINKIIKNCFSFKKNLK